MPFKTLNLSPLSASASDVLRAWRRLALKHHTDKTGAEDDGAMQALNEAKERCMEAVVARDYAASEQEFVRHICWVLGRKLASDDADLHSGLLEHGGNIIRPRLREFFYVRGVDAVEWVMMCAMGDPEVQFNADTDNEIPVLCRFYNDFIGQDDWTEHDHTMMTVLNKYGDIKARGHGNFARFLEQPTPS